MSYSKSQINTVSVAGYASCGYHQKALAAAQAFFGTEKVNDRTFASRDLYKTWLNTKDGLTFTGNPSKNYGADHTSSPFTWINESTFVGGCDDTMAMLEELENEQAAGFTASQINTVSVAGYASCGYHQKALAAAQAFFGTEKVNDRTFASRDLYKTWLNTKDGLTFTGNPSKNYGADHTSSPFTWINESTFVGGCDDTMAMLEELENKKAAAAAPSHGHGHGHGHSHATPSLRGPSKSFLSASTYTGLSKSITSLPMTTHIAELTAARNEHAGDLYVLYVGATDAAGKSWCGDCTAIQSYLSAIPSNSMILECQISRNEWKNEPGQAHPFRTMRFGNVDGVPTLVKIGTTVRGIASLNDAGIKDDVLFKHLIEA